MKKLFTLFSAATLLVTAANAQRNIDLESTITDITPDTVGLNESFSVYGVLKNVGAQPLKTTDSIFFGWTIGGSGIDFTGSGQATVYYRTGISLNVGDTVHVKRTNISFTGYASGVADSTKDFCLVLLPIINRGVDAAVDPNTSNNTGCHNLTLKAQNTSVGDYAIETASAHRVGLYPNPAKSMTRLELDMQSNSTAILRIFDITGKMVYENDYGRLSKGHHEFAIPVNHLQEGVYLYRVDMEGQSENGKLSILK